MFIKKKNWKIGKLWKIIEQVIKVIKESNKKTGWEYFRTEQNQQKDRGPNASAHWINDKPKWKWEKWLGKTNEKSGWKQERRYEIINEE